MIEMSESVKFVSVINNVNMSLEDGAGAETEPEDATMEQSFSTESLPLEADIEGAQTSKEASKAEMQQFPIDTLEESNRQLETPTDEDYYFCMSIYKTISSVINNVTMSLEDGAGAEAKPEDATIEQESGSAANKRPMWYFYPSMTYFADYIINLSSITSLCQDGAGAEAEPEDATMEQSFSTESLPLEADVEESHNEDEVLSPQVHRPPKRRSKAEMQQFLIDTLEESNKQMIEMSESVKCFSVINNVTMSLEDGAKPEDATMKQSFSTESLPQEADVEESHNEDEVLSPQVHRPPKRRSKAEMQQFLIDTLEESNKQMIEMSESVKCFSVINNVTMSLEDGAKPEDATMKQSFSTESLPQEAEVEESHNEDEVLSPQVHRPPKRRSKAEMQQFLIDTLEESNKQMIEMSESVKCFSVINNVTMSLEDGAKPEDATMKQSFSTESLPQEADVEKSHNEDEVLSPQVHRPSKRRSEAEMQQFLIDTLEESNKQLETPTDEDYYF
ncbi:hypothetical protein GQR58_001018 [Nymphon striatum]|nr:hypothetical protein GQR58_001018 [Nymphon striatum]